MVDSASFNLQPNFPIAGVAELYANRPVKEAAIRAQQQKQLVEGLQAFGGGVDSLVNRRLQMAQALASAHLFSGTPQGQKMLGTNPVASVGASPSPVIANQTANFDQGTGTITPNKSPVTMNDLATSMTGLAPKDLLENMTQQKQLSYKPQELDIEQQRAKAEADNNAILRAIQLRLAGNTEQHTKSEEINNLLERKAELSKDLPTGFLNSIGNVKGKEAQKEIDAIDVELSRRGYSTTASTGLPSVGQTVSHPSGVKITRLK